MSIFNKENFSYYLKKRGLAESTIRKNAVQAHNRIFNELGISFYELEDLSSIQTLYKDVKVLEGLMEKNPNRFYSSAVANYLKFVASFSEREIFSTEMVYEQEVEVVEIKEETIEIKPVKVSREVILNGRKTYYRNPKIAKMALNYHDFSCQIDKHHKTFISKATQRNYVEAHHLIPISYQGLFDYGIDTVSNILSLCPNCHRKIHFSTANEQKEMLHFLFQKQVTDLLNTGIEITEKELYELYL
ncbi:HNH endonuclease [Pilibacter termitis]|uniref:HNH endonuclease n=1 Tax=Pilibacter termitis TaxID=263852 RepID=A0A1T4NYB5_9ENTE|nr:HNH endonuclease [Pilibacter termitis]SJZ84211.1 HNH endonuclease [Pilibacter termitis]